jgi:hypothetical protein
MVMELYISEYYLKLADRLGEYIVQGSCSTWYEAIAEEEIVKLTCQMRKKGSPQGSCSTCYEAVAEKELVKLTWQMRKKGSPQGSCSTCYEAVAEKELVELAGE